MITVIKDNQQKHQTTCENCGAILEYSKVDIKRIYRHGGDGWGYHYEYYEYFIICPVCNRRTRVKEESIT